MLNKNTVVKIILYRVQIPDKRRPRLSTAFEASKKKSTPALIRVNTILATIYNIESLRYVYTVYRITFHVNKLSGIV